MKYDKPALSFDQQIDRLEGRGMIFGDRVLAARYLREINYYRLRGYWLRREINHVTHELEPGTVLMFRRSASSSRARILGSWRDRSASTTPGTPTTP